jgi:hypothetical protein
MVQVDPAGAKLYWADQASGKIQRSNLDGTGVQDVLAGLEDPSGVAIDPTAGKLYWCEDGDDNVSTPDDLIRRSDLDGSSPETLVTGLLNPQAIRLDPDGGKMYWGGFYCPGIQRANTNGTEVETIVPSVDGRICLDLDADMLYWTNYWDGEIGRSSLDGSGPTIILDGLTYPKAIGVVPEPASLALLAISGLVLLRRRTTEKTSPPAATAASRLLSSARSCPSQLRWRC